MSLSFPTPTVGMKWTCAIQTVSSSCSSVDDAANLCRVEMSRLTLDGTAEPVSRDQFFRRARGQGDICFPCSADHVQDWQPYPVDPYSCYLCDHTCSIYVDLTPKKTSIVSARQSLLAALFSCKKSCNRPLSAHRRTGYIIIVHFLLHRRDFQLLGDDACSSAIIAAGPLVSHHIHIHPSTYKGPPSTDYPRRHQNEDAVGTRHARLKWRLWRTFTSSRHARVTN